MCDSLCGEAALATNLNLDDALIDEAVALGGHASKRDAVNQALREYVAHLKRVRAIRQFGTFDFDPSYDYKKSRQRRPA